MTLEQAIHELTQGPSAWVHLSVDGQVTLAEPPSGLIVPGSFNPLHAGHTELAAVAERRTSLVATFEISVFNVDKPPLPVEEIARRTTQFLGRSPVVLTKAPTFAEKSRLFPGRIFAIGADTAARVIDRRYHGHDEGQLHLALNGIRDQGCRFLVGGRAIAGGPFVELNALPIPSTHQDLFDGLTEAEFRIDLSSTELRVKKNS